MAELIVSVYRAELIVIVYRADACAKQRSTGDIRSEAHLALLGVDQPLADALNADARHKLPDLVIIYTSPQCTKEVNGLAGEGVHKRLNLLLGDIVMLENTSAHTHTVLTGGSPVELLHTPITNQGCIQSAEIVTCSEVMP